MKGFNRYSVDELTSCLEGKKHKSHEFVAPFRINVYLRGKNQYLIMTNDISESISQGFGGEETEETRRIQEIADELGRRCSLYETQFREGKADGDGRIEQRVAEDFAKETGMWLSISEIFDIGIPGPCGNENDTYVSNEIIYKVNNLLNSSGSIIRLLQKVIWHNKLFVDTAYSLYAFTGFDGSSVMPILRQSFVHGAIPATDVEIETYMAALGFSKLEAKGHYSNGEYEVWDLFPRNVLKDNEGDIYVIDAEICQLNNFNFFSKGQRD